MNTAYLAVGWLLVVAMAALTIWTVASDPTQLSSLLLGATIVILFLSLTRSRFRSPLFGKTEI